MLSPLVSDHRTLKSFESRNPSAQSLGRGTRLALEQLEERCVPATIAGVFGGSLWNWTDTAGFEQLTTATPSLVAPGDGGAVVAEFQGAGVWRAQGSTGWKQLSAGHATQLGMDNDGDVVGQFSSGVYRYEDATGWVQLSAGQSSQLAMDCNGNIVGQFSSGVWRYENATGWKQLSAGQSSRISIAGDGDVVGQFSSGVYRYKDATGWEKLSAGQSSQLAMDSNGNVVGEFAGAGVWRYKDATGWRQLTGTDASHLGISSAPSSGSVAAVFPGRGVWLYTDSGGWKQLTPSDAPLFAYEGSFHDVAPLDQVVQGSSFSLTNGSGQTVGFTLSAMQLAGTRALGGTTFKFFNDKPNVAAWTPAQMNVVMQGVTQVNHLTHDNNVLLIDPKYGRVFNFVLTDHARLVQVLGREGDWIGLNADQGNARLIAFLPWDTTDPWQNTDQIRTVQHEMAHNFDASSEKYFYLQQEFPNGGQTTIYALAFLHWQWVGQSGWLPTNGFLINDGQEIADRSAWTNYFGRPTSQLLPSADGRWYYVPSSNFARDYGKSNPYEDWTTTFEVYESIVDGTEGTDWRTTRADLLNKLEIMDEFFAFMGNTTQGNLFSSAELQTYYNNAYKSSTGYQGIRVP